MRILSPADCFRSRPHVLVTHDAGTKVLVDGINGARYRLGGIGGRVWGYIEAGAPVLVIARSLWRQYDVARDRLEADLVLLLDQLAQAGLIERYN